MKFEHITGYHNLWITLGDLIPSLDLNTSMNMQSHHFALKDGEAVFTHSYYNMLEVMNERFDTKFIPEMCSFIGATHFTLAFAEEGDTVVEEEVVEPDTVIPEVVQEDKPLVSLGIEDSSDDGIDWDWINSLENTKDDKMELDVFAEKEHGIKLKRTKKISGMIEDFKAALEAK